MRTLKLLTLIVACGLISVSCSNEEVTIEDAALDNEMFRKSKPDKDKINICHYSANEDQWVLLNVNRKSWTEHVTHGDELLDADGDGYTAANNCGFGSMDDCDDTNAAINPSATEVCGDGIDNNCDGQVDENCVVVPTVTSAGGRIWMDRNLGASRVATYLSDVESYGDLYQWGRGTDGHEKRNSETTETLSTTDQPGHNKFILTPGAQGSDWRNPSNNTLWQGAAETNNPCPPGFRLPTKNEWMLERNSWSSITAEGAYNSPLKLPKGSGHRLGNGVISNASGRNGFYWSNYPWPTTSNVTNGGGMLYITEINSGVLPYPRGLGACVRCIKKL